MPLFFSTSSAIGAPPASRVRPPGENMPVHAGAAAIRQSGARLTVVFQAEGKEGGATSKAPLEVEGRKLRLLIVEDDALIAMDLAVSVSELGGQVVSVAVSA